LGYNTPPAYFYETQSVPACPGQAAPASPAWINVDETTQIGLDQMFAGGPAIQDSANTAPQLIRFAAKANHVEYGYVAQNQYFLPDKLKLPAMNNQNAYNYTKNMPPVAPTTPALAYEDSTAPKVTVTPEGASFCTPQNNLYFKDNPNFAGLTGGAAICINQRYGPIPSDVIAVNLAAHVAITSYDTANGIGNSPWLYYKLVSVQATPFDVSTISPTDPIHGPAAFFQANIVVETDYTLQRFQGNFADSLAPTALGIPPANVFIPTANPPPGVVGVNMGGCMGCHGSGAQVSGGTDFSFILAEVSGAFIDV
jgi:hypothetical protein